MMKVVLKVDLYDERIKQKVMKTASGLSGVESVLVDMKDKKLTLTGDIDPVHVVGKLRKWCHAEIISVGPAKEEKKKEQSKPNDKDSTEVSEFLKLYEAYPFYYEMRPPHYNQHYYVTCVKEDPVSCVIC